MKTLHFHNDFQTDPNAKLLLYTRTSAIVNFNYMKRIFSTKIESKKIPFTIRKLTIFYVIPIHALDYL